MARRSGYLVQFFNSNGAVQKGVCYHDEQTPEYQLSKRVFIRLLTNDYADMKDDAGRRMIAVKQASEVRITGYTD